MCDSENETEVSFFNRDLYEKFKLNPEVRFTVSVRHLATDLRRPDGSNLLFDHFLRWGTRVLSTLLCGRLITWSLLGHLYTTLQIYTLQQASLAVYVRA